MPLLLDLSHNWREYGDTALLATLLVVMVAPFVWVTM